jgi:excisionase family DNA binding protein
MKKIGHSSQSLLTLEQVAEYLNVNKFTVYRLLAQNDLPAFKVGNQWRFKRELVEAWLTKNAKNPQTHSAIRGTT